MKKLLVIVGFCLLPLAAWSQGEFMNKTNNIAPLNKGMAPAPTNSIYTPNVFNPGQAKTSTSSSGIPDKKVEFAQPEFANPGDRYVDKLNHKEDRGDYKEFRKNQYLGDFKSNANSVKISCRDFGEVDGDMIKVMVNDKVMYEKIYLTGNYTTLELGLVKGFNRIDFEALNQGMLGPNTAQFMVTDDKGILISSNQWNLATGFKATIIIFKE